MAEPVIRKRTEIIETHTSPGDEAIVASLRRGVEELKQNQVDYANAYNTALSTLDKLPEEIASRQLEGMGASDALHSAALNSIRSDYGADHGGATAKSVEALHSRCTL